MNQSDKQKADQQSTHKLTKPEPQQVQQSHVEDEFEDFDDHGEPLAKFVQHSSKERAEYCSSPMLFEMMRSWTTNVLIKHTGYPAMLFLQCQCGLNSKSITLLIVN